MAALEREEAIITAARQIEKLTAWKHRLLPQGLPQVHGWEWSGYSSESAWPGGDYFDVLPLDKTHWLVFLGDAAGHGGAAAVMAAMARMVLHSCPLTSSRERQPFCPLHGWTQSSPVIASRLNNVLLDNSLDEQFMCAFLGRWEPQAARLDFVLAGQPLPQVWRQAHGKVEPVADRAGLPLGISATETYSPSRIVFDPGDAVVIFTDGLIEACNTHGEMFGTARVRAIMQERGSQGAEAVTVNLLAGLIDFLNGDAPQDDVTFLVLRRWG